MDERDEKKTRVGAGIITVSVLYFIGGIFSLVGMIPYVVANQSTNDNANKMMNAIGGLNGLKINVTVGTALISVITSLAIIISVILILYKKKIGAYAFLIVSILSIIYSTVTRGFNIVTFLMSLILPVLMCIFINLRKEAFGFGNKHSDEIVNDVDNPPLNP